METMVNRNNKKFPKSFNSYNRRYYGTLNAPETPTKDSLDKLNIARNKLNSVKHLDLEHSKKIERVMRDTSGYSDSMIQRLTEYATKLYATILSSILLNPI